MASARVVSLYASSDPRAVGVPTNNQRGQESRPCLLLSFGQVESYSSYRLVSQNAMF